MSFNTTPTSGTNNLPYMGIQEQNPRETYIRRRDPTVNDYRGYKLGDRWINKATGTWCTLVSRTNSIATWLCISGTTFVNSINGCSGAITLSGGIAIDLLTTCPALTIDVLVDGVTVGVNGFNQLTVIPSGILDSLQFDPDVGVNVSPVGAILQVPGLGGNQTLDGGAGVLQFNNRRWFSAFTVDPSAVPGLDAEYTTIQSAINAATGPAVVYIRAGVYTEDLVLKDGVDLIGIQGTGRLQVPSVQVIGSHTYSGATNLLVSEISFLSTVGDTFTITPPAGFLIFGAFNCSINASAPGGRGVFLNPAGGAFAVFGSFNNNFFTDGAVLEASGTSQGLIFDSQCFNGAGDSFIANDSAAITVDDSEIQNSLNVYKITSATASITSTNNTITGDTIVNFTAPGTMNMYHDTLNASSGTTLFVTGAGTFNFADVVNRGSANVISGATTQAKQNWQPYGESGLLATAYRGTAAFDNAQFTVTDGFVQIIAGSSVTTVGVDTFTPPGSDPVLPNGSNVIDFTGAQIAAGSTGNVIQTNSTVASQVIIEIQRSSAQAVSTVTENGVSHFDSAQFTVDGNGFVQIIAGSSVTTLGVDTFTAPGTDPVVPNGSNVIDVTGAQVAAGTTANVIRTDSTVANQLIIEVQRSSAQVASTLAANGVSHYDSSQFTVDANGFVEIIASAFVTNIGVDVFTPPGTDPVVPNGSGTIDFTGAQVAAGTTANVIRTNSTVANQTIIEIQRASAQAVSTVASNGVSHFDSADFSVNASGFVTLLGTGMTTWNLISVNTVGLTNNGYIAVSPGGALTVSLPATSAVGDIFELVLDGSTSWQLTQAAGQQVRLGALTTTLGAGGSLTSTSQGDHIRLVCRTANTLWTAVGYTGVITVV
mgnify:CR=1 FL=1